MNKICSFQLGKGHPRQTTGPGLIGIPYQEESLQATLVQPQIKIHTKIDVPLTELHLDTDTGDG